MAERKVLNKYYDPEYDPRKIPKKKGCTRNTQWNIRTMTPCSMRCNNCGEYIYKAKKFNSKMETVQKQTYLGIKIYRFYIRCPKCIAEITFITDPENGDYNVENGATRNYESLRVAEKLEEKERKSEEEREKSDPIRAIEKRMEVSNKEMKMLEDLEELQNTNDRNDRTDTGIVMKMINEKYSTRARKEMMEDEAIVDSIFGRTRKDALKRLPDEPSEEMVGKRKIKKQKDKRDPSKQKLKDLRKETWQCSIGGLSSSKSGLKMLIKKKKASE